MLNLYDYGARFYDPALGRFNHIDRFAEMYTNLTPYHYCANNPILFVDINGDFFTFGDDNEDGSEEEGLLETLENRLIMAESELSQQRSELEGSGASAEEIWNFDENTGLCGVEDALTEIEDMRNSSMEFNINLTDLGGADIFGNFSGGDFALANRCGVDRFEIQVNENPINTNRVGSLGHELKHGSQFMLGEIDFNEYSKNKYEPGELYGIEDERAARNRATKLYDQNYTGTVEQAYPKLQYGGSMGRMKPNQLDFYKSGKTNIYYGK